MSLEFIIVLKKYNTRINSFKHYTNLLWADKGSTHIPGKERMLPLFLYNIYLTGTDNEDCDILG
jgi:hypothetical protein